MKTLSSTPQRLLVAGALAPLLALAACSGEAAVTSAPTASQKGTTPATTSSTSTGTSDAPSTSASAGSDEWRTIKVDKVLRDPAFGHAVVVRRVVRNAPWPIDSPVNKATFEIVAVEVELQAGSRYSATLEQGMFSIKSSSQQPALTTLEFKPWYQTRSMPAVATAKHGEKTKGWLVFKVEPKDSPTLTLVYTRPPYKVSNTSKAIPAANISIKLDG